MGLVGGGSGRVEQRDIVFSGSSGHILKCRVEGDGVGPNSLPLSCEPAGRFDRNLLQLAPSFVDAPPVQLVC